MNRFLPHIRLLPFSVLLMLSVSCNQLSSQNQYQTPMQNPEEIQPQPSMGPREVVDLQVKAMQQNDHPYENHGIEVAYRFASPDNKKNTGPIDRFTRMLNNEIYQSLLNAQQYGLDAVEIEGEIAVQKVTLIDTQDQPVVYYFQLSRQKEGSLKDCWLTDSVVRY